MTSKHRAVAAAVFLGSTALVAGTAWADGPPIRTRVYAPAAILDPDEVRDYRMEQMERRHEMEREALRFHQRVERRSFDQDDDD